MEKTTTLNLRVNSKLKTDAQEILSKLGIPMSTAIAMYLNQIVMVKGIPFQVTIPNFPSEIDASKMNKSQLSKKLKQGYDDYLNDDVEDAYEFFNEFKKENFNEEIQDSTNEIRKNGH